MRDQVKPLSVGAKELLEDAATGAVPWGSVKGAQRRGYLKELEPRGYATRRGDNGQGCVAITPRGILKALADGLIDRHPDENASMLSRHRELRRTQDLERLWGPGR